MNEELRKVIRGYEKLSQADKDEFKKKTSGMAFDSGRLNEQIEKSSQITMGPLGNSCPCCGK